ncbi:MAG: 30S ribosomal protein S17 [Patescibacteria group bacterium]|nr:30S ribosomal protein S17 [Patescibacteria group bacterium]
MIGKVVSDKMEKTVVVLVERLVPHPLYRKSLKKSSKFKVHDEIGAKLNDTVRIEASRPISKDKHFKVVEVIK